ncbi:MAG: hypothetical protein ACK5NG_06935 [Chthoniobacterales bacterium]
METLIHGVFPPRNFLKLLQHFIVFEEDPGSGAVHKILAGYHQVHAVNAAVKTVLQQAELLCAEWA